MKPVKILGIETSCDETAISLIEVDEKSEIVKILGNTVHSQIDIHAQYGGVFPILAKREHQINLIPVFMKTLTEAGAYEEIETKREIGKGTAKMKKGEEMTEKINEIEQILNRESELFPHFKKFISNTKKPDIDYIAVTIGPGLEPALWVGINFARALSHVWNIPIIPCNHMEGHILTALIEKGEKIKKGKEGNEKKNGVDGIYKLLHKTISYPALSLLISGGHTQIVLIGGIGNYKIVGETRDDAIGECFDKIARTLGLPYPGGPQISKLASEARKANIKSPEPLPRPMIASDDMDFSFSGLKTSVLYLTRKLKEKSTPPNSPLENNVVCGIARETEDAITDVIVTKMKKAIEKFAVETIIIGGGVIANTHIREELEKLAGQCSIKILLPQFDHATDNGLMIALAGYFNRSKTVDSSTALKAIGTLPIGPRI
ncbi:MAG: tRNA (adenosine(37)-N6)-threonylcarbamoyltransferase complex transferase subunit TsaD [bacterium]|nr:tRNA (adenosine(37)-N6)-threonylcarbamoyltransferase complex transferase subunit TsaD [bacterium]